MPDQYARGQLAGCGAVSRLSHDPGGRDWVGPGERTVSEIHNAARKGMNEELLRLLVSGADPDTENSQRQTPLHLVAQDGFSTKLGARRSEAEPGGQLEDTIDSGAGGRYPRLLWGRMALYNRSRDRP